MKRLCVFCGSNPGRRPSYVAAAAELGRLMAERGLDLVFGGGRVGMMGTVADAVLAEGGEAIGVIPGALVEKEVAHEDLTELRVVGSMHERKAMMADLADGFVALPGGLGTLDEFFEIWTWAQLGIHAKPVGLLNTGGYFDRLLGFLDHTVEEQFVSGVHRGVIVVHVEPGALLDRLAAAHPVSSSKWLTRDER